MSHHQINIQEIARHYGGEVSGNQALIPTIGHSKSDRGTCIKAEPSAPDGCLVHCFNGDALAEKDRLRADGFLPQLGHGQHRSHKPQPNVNWDNLPGYNAGAPVVAEGWQTQMRWDYTDAEGNILYRKKRVNQGDADKVFYYEQPDGSSSKGGLTHILYRLPDLVQSDGLVFMAEGERCADKLASWGLAATSSKEADKCDLSALSGRTVVILPDNDDRGASIAEKATEALTRAGAFPILVELPNLSEHGDIVDWEGDLEDLIALAEAKWAETKLQAQPKMRKSTFSFTAVGELEVKQPEFLVEGLIESDTLGLIFGDPGCGKSFIAVDVGMSVAAGVEYHGSAVKQGAVFFIAGEGHNGLTRRMNAWAKDRGLNRLADIPLFKSNRAAQFLDADVAADVIEAIKRMADQYGNPSLIIVDTLARNFGPGDENSTKDMSDFVASLDDLKAHFPSCTIMIVHHTGHAEKGRARGAMALKAALDWEYRIAKDNHYISISNTKMKDAEPPNSLLFELTDVEVDEEGNSSATLKLARERNKRDSSLTDVQKFARRTFIDAAAANTSEEDGQGWLALEDWREAFYTKHTADNVDTKRKAFERVRKNLQAKGMLEVENDTYAWQCPTIGLEIAAQRNANVLERDTGTGQDIVGTCLDAEA